MIDFVELVPARGESAQGAFGGPSGHVAIDS